MRTISAFLRGPDANGIESRAENLTSSASRERAAVAIRVPGHLHGDHTGGNAPFAGDGAVVIAQDNIYKRMSTEQFIRHLNRSVPPSPKAALPVVTFDDEATIHFNGEANHLIHPRDAHTDGDALVHFPDADVIHMGDCFFNGMYPIIDTGTGGTIDGYIAADEKALSLSGPETKIVPGHGPLADRAQLSAFVAMLKQARTAVATLKSAGKTLEETQAAHPTAALDAEWAKGFVKPDLFVKTIWESLPGK